MTKPDNPLAAALKKSRSTFWAVGLFSCAVNILMLTGPLFMLQVYDRVLASRSVPTLLALFALVAALYLFLGLFDLIRTKALSRIGYGLDVELSALAKKVWIFSNLHPGSIKSRPINDLASLRQFLSSNGLPALFDLPWVPIYLAIVYLLHTWLGLLATAGAIIVVTATMINELITRKPIWEASSWELRDAQFAEGAHRNAEAVVAMGMTSRVTSYWQSLRDQALIKAQEAGGRSEFITAFTKSIRMLVQSGMLALGAYLAIFQEISPGTMIAASILGGRALAPVDAAVANWKNFIRSRLAYGRLSKMLQGNGDNFEPINLPDPKGRVTVTNLLKLPPKSAGSQGDQRPILQGLHFDLNPGDGLGVIGPSASGKSSLARLLVGLWMPDKGSVRLDGATFDQWDRDAVGQYIGYLPQSVELLSGTIRQNIARFDAEVSDEDVIAAAQLAAVHELILALPDGYSTDLAVGQQVLSGGQVQRIGLARAALRTPPLVVLDEPNSNLDADGDDALTHAIAKLREAGSCVVVMAHRPSAIEAVNKVLMLRNGQQVEFGDKNEVLQKVMRAPTAPSKQTTSNEQQPSSKRVLKPVSKRKM
ncbi:alkaline protease secretion ATP-binding protein AprD [Roseibium sp. TrichSKD4]|uniref:type I secretion system permease/ATPase n=1 Tax=Roseibium sp. TrichSKD4 TaxID=744980 RepID=UPI0001E5712D|nr:type I secretion system permease/ATPase [Roseibium sp. TrichSKD4]EFO28695.1 alkaline protease secretion ATP-binding protein AprD [Roseibium sp. TrichSKD4]